jgi:hypothetical protein
MNIGQLRTNLILNTKGYSNLSRLRNLQQVALLRQKVLYIQQQAGMIKFIPMMGQIGTQKMVKRYNNA